MATFQNDFRNVSIQNLVDNPDCTEDDVAQWVRDNSDKFEDDSHPGEFSQDKANKLFGDVIQNNALGSSMGNLGIDYSSVVDWFNMFGGQDKKKSQQGGTITDSVLTWGKKLLGFPDAQEEDKPANKPSAGGFGMGKFDLGTLMKYSKNPKLKKVLWVFDTIFKEVKKLWPAKRRRTTTRRTTTAKRATTSRSRTTAAKKTTSRSTTAKKTAAKKTPARTTTAKKTTAKKATTRSTTAKKTTAKKPSTKKIW